MDVLIRPGRADEAADLSDLALRSKAHWGYDQAFLDRCRPELTLTPTDVKQRRTAVAELDGKIAGFVTVVGDPAAPAPAGSAPGVVEGELDMLFIDPWAIGQGVGRRLFDHAAKAAAAEGFTALFIVSDPQAEGFYLRLGAIRDGESVSPSTGRALPLLRYALPRH